MHSSSMSFQQSARNIRNPSSSFNNFGAIPGKASVHSGSFRGGAYEFRTLNIARKAIESAAGRKPTGSNSFGTYSVAALSQSVAPRTKVSANKDNVSVYSGNLEERLKDGGHPLRGPIMIQMTFHYIYFLLVLTTANFSNWAPYIRFFMGLFYGALAFFILQMSRIIYAYGPNSVVPFYLSLAPFFLLVFISREAHMLIMLLWYVSFLVIFLQSGHESLQKHLIIYSVILLAMYGCAMIGMSVFYTASCTSLYSCGIALSEPINPYDESVIGAGCCFVVGCFIMLERFIKMNAITLLERENYMNQLYLVNIDLKRQLRRARNDEEIDLEAPLTRATQILKEVKDSLDLDPDVADEIDLIIEVLATDQLYNPDIYQKPADAEVHDWLNDMLLPTASRNDPMKGKSGASSSMHSNPSFTISGVEATPPSAVTHTKEVSFSPSVDHAITTVDAKVFSMLKDIENPNFDIFDIERISNGRVLYYIGWYIFRLHDVFETHRMSESTFRHWLAKVESGYKPTNPYHNSMHAADVLHSMHYYVTRKRLWPHLTTDEKVAVFIAPIIHDYMHPGVNNAFLISNLSPLTIRYNDQSVLENFHSASIFELMQQEEYNILASFSPESRRQIRESVVSMVLATDMAMHFDWVGKFKNKLSGAGFNFENKQDRKLILNIAIKCADVNNPAKPTDTCKKWTDFICEEFFRQGDEEKKKGIPISMFMNRETTDVPKCQIGFIDFIVQPLFEAWGGFMLEDLRPQLDNIAANKSFWRFRSDKAASSIVTVEPKTAPSVHTASVSNLEDNEKK